MYKGKYLDGSNEKIESNYILLEPAFMAGLGSRVFHFDFIFGLQFHPTFEVLSSKSNARYIFNIGFGITKVIGREKDN